MKKSFVLVAVAAVLCGTSAIAQTIVNIPAVDPTRADYSALPVLETFGPGTYTAQVVGRAGGGLYDAWGVATPAAGNYDERYAIGFADGSVTQVDPYNSQRAATAADALNAYAGLLTTFTLTSQSNNVLFGIPDNFWYDNTGGVSLLINQIGSPTPVPEPATMGLFARGGGMLLARRRKQRAAAKA